MPSVCGLDVAFILDLVLTDTNTYVKDRENSSISFLSVICNFLLKLFHYNSNENNLTLKRPDENILHIQIFNRSVQKLTCKFLNNSFVVEESNTSLMVISTSFVKEVWEASFSGHKQPTGHCAKAQGSDVYST